MSNLRNRITQMEGLIRESESNEKLYENQNLHDLLKGVIYKTVEEVANDENMNLLNRDIQIITNAFLDYNKQGMLDGLKSKIKTSILEYNKD